MRIGIDARLWDETGVGRYIRNLISYLHQIDKKNHYVLFVTPEAFQSDLFDFIKEKESKWTLVKTDIRWHSIEEQLLFYKVLENESLDLVHFPYFSIPILYNQPYVITIHDLIINHFPTGKASTLPSPLYHVKRLGYKFVLKETAKKAQKIIAVSEATKQEIIDHLPVTKEKVIVTYEGVDAKISKANDKDLKKYHVSKSDKYFLYVGNAYPHKNGERLLEAFSKVISDNPEVKLVMVGKMNYFYERLKQKSQSLNLQNSVIFTGAVADEELSALYKNAQALVLPSLMEGFGLPGLEAMQQGCLVIASEIPVFKEIYKDAAIYFNPLDIQQLNDTMQKVLAEKESFDALQERGLKISKQFSWKIMAEQTLAIYESSISIR